MACMSFTLSLYFSTITLTIYAPYQQGNVIKNEVGGFNPGLIVLLVVGGLLVLFLVGNYALYMYAQKTLPPRKKKPISKKKMRKERLKQGVSAPGE